MQLGCRYVFPCVPAHVDISDGPRPRRGENASMEKTCLHRSLHSVHWYFRRKVLFLTISAAPPSLRLWPLHYLSSTRRLTWSLLRLRVFTSSSFCSSSTSKSWGLLTRWPRSRTSSPKFSSEESSTNCKRLSTAGLRRRAPKLQVTQTFFRHHHHYNQS